MTIFEQYFDTAIYVIRVAILMASAGFLGMLIKLIRFVGWRTISPPAKALVAMLVTMSVNFIAFYLIILFTDPVVSFASLANVGYLVVVLLGYRFVALAKIQQQGEKETIDLGEGE